MTSERSLLVEDSNDPAGNMTRAYSGSIGRRVADAAIDGVCTTLGWISTVTYLATISVHLMCGCYWASLDQDDIDVDAKESNIRLDAYNLALLQEEMGSVEVVSAHGTLSPAVSRLACGANQEGASLCEEGMSSEGQTLCDTTSDAASTVPTSFSVHNQAREMYPTTARSWFDRFTEDFERRKMNVGGRRSSNSSEPVEWLFFWDHFDMQTPALFDVDLDIEQQ